MRAPRLVRYASRVTPLQAFILGIVQGLTEFLPVSSSGHLVLVEYFFSVDIDPLSLQGFNVLLHAGTLLALVLLYRERWWRMCAAPFTGDAAHARLLLLLCVATVPGAVAGLLFEEGIARTFGTPLPVGMAFLVTAVVLIVGERAEQAKKVEHLTVLHACFIGVAQACALAPGLSRSGLTISAARVLRVDRREALDFSFLMAVPIIAGATAVSAWHLREGATVLPPLQTVAIGFFAAFVASIFAVQFLRRYVALYSLAWFSWYLVFAGILMVAYPLLP